MKTYEIMFVVTPDIDEAAINQTAKDVENIIKSVKGEIGEVKALGQKTLAYEMKKHKMGYYFYIDYKLKDQKQNAEINRLILINENVLKHLIVKTEQPKEKK